MTALFRVRPARSDDRDRMLEITRDVWDGTDYFPFVWERWLQPSAGTLLSALVGEEVVGFLRVAMQPDSTAWLEGVRIAERARGGGLGTKLVEAGIGWARERGCVRARLSTASTNVGSNRMAENAGMEVIATFVPVLASGQPPAEDQRSLPVRVAPTTSRADALRFLATRSDPGVGLHTEGWTAYSLTEERLAMLLATFAVVTAGHDRIEAVGIATAGIGGTVKLGALQGSEDGIAAIGTFVRGAADRAGLGPPRAMLSRNTLPAMERAGYEPGGDFEMHVYETLLA